MGLEQKNPALRDAAREISDEEERRKNARKEPWSVVPGINDVDEHTEVSLAPKTSKQPTKEGFLSKLFKKEKNPEESELNKAA